MAQNGSKDVKNTLARDNLKLESTTVKKKIKIFYS